MKLQIRGELELQVHSGVDKYGKPFLMIGKELRNASSDSSVSDFKVLALTNCAERRL